MNKRRKTIELHFKHLSKRCMSFMILFHYQGNIHPSRSNLLKEFLTFIHTKFMKCHQIKPYSSVIGRYLSNNNCWIPNWINISYWTLYRKL